MARIALSFSSTWTGDMHTIRHSTNLEIYYDRIFVAQDAGTAGVEIRSAPLVRARLRRLGFPREYSPDGCLPTLYDYDYIDASAPFHVLKGAYTRYGPVEDLLKTRSVPQGPGKGRRSWSAPAFSAPYTNFCRTQAFVPPRIQGPSLTSQPSTGPRRVTPATFSGTVPASGHRYVFWPVPSNVMGPAMPLHGEAWARARSRKLRRPIAWLPKMWQVEEPCWSGNRFRIARVSRAASSTPARMITTAGEVAIHAGICEEKSREPAGTMKQNPRRPLNPRSPAGCLRLTWELRKRSHSGFHALRQSRSGEARVEPLFPAPFPAELAQLSFNRCRQRRFLRPSSSAADILAKTSSKDPIPSMVVTPWS
jgi:hypothetical protein